MSANERISPTSDVAQYASTVPTMLEVPVKIESPELHHDESTELETSVKPELVMIKRDIEIKTEKVFEVEVTVECEQKDIKMEPQDCDTGGDDNGAPAIDDKEPKTTGTSETLQMEEYITSDIPSFNDAHTSAGLSKHITKIYNKTSSKYRNKEASVATKQNDTSVVTNNVFISDRSQKQDYGSDMDSTEKCLSKNYFSETAENPYAYKICDQRFAVLDSLKADIIKFNNGDDIQKQIRQHMSEKPFRCDNCDKMFVRKSDFKKHLIIHSGEKPYTCDICEKKFSQSSNLSDHIRIHTGEKPFACKLCDKKFNQRSHLYKHSKTHGGAKPYTCNFCDKSFAVLDYLHKHIRTHTGEKPHTCEICNKKFSESSALNKHKVTHTDVKRFVCEMCDKKFRQKIDLMRHIRLHTGERPYACKLCDKQFTQHSNLVSHSRTHAGETLVETVYACNSNSN